MISSVLPGSQGPFKLALGSDTVLSPTSLLLSAPAGMDLVIPLATDGVTTFQITSWILGSEVGWSRVCRFLPHFWY